LTLDAGGSTAPKVGRVRLRGLLVGATLALACVLVTPLSARAAETHPPFSVEPGSFKVTTSNGQAGAHADLTTSFGFQLDPAGGVGALLRNVEVVLPVGFAGYPTAIRTCTPVQLQNATCPVDSQIGTLELVFRAVPAFTNTFTAPVFNMVPPPGETAVFGIKATLLSANIVVSVGPDYRLHARVSNVKTGTELTRESLTLWGVPAEPSHDAERGSKFNCEQFTGEPERHCREGGFSTGENPAAFLVNPTQCTPAPLTANVYVESWEGARSESSTAVGPYTGCDSLRFEPTIALQPEQTQATTPTGYEVDLKVPQSEGAEGLATADLRDAVVRLPAGIVLSPSAANGLQTCTEAQVGLGSEQPVQCPNASKLGEVSLITPALTGELKGALYLGGPPSGTITGPPFTVYLTLAGHGVLVKVKGTATPNLLTGQVTTVFDENPELPFSELKLQLNGGSRSTVANPSVCGPYYAESDLTPWSSPFTPDTLTSSAPFQITGCQAPRFTPTFEAGTTSNQAGGYSPLSVTFAREDADQDLGGLTVTTPPGLEGSLAHVPLCGEPQAREGTCGPESEIGQLTAGAGPGPEPYFIKGGRVYITGPYHGAPFGLSIDVSEHAGPFDLGSGPCDCEVVRATVNVNPHTAQLTVANETLPTIKDGIPFQVKQVNVLINRPEFIFNPTSCDPMSVTGELTSTQGMRAAVSNHTQVTNCAALKFEPKLTASTQGRTSKSAGASLSVKIANPATPQGAEANIARFKVELPKQLPSRLTTLQKACTAAQFEANPAGCPAASIVGRMRVLTPLLPVPVEGPMYFVSHGGEAFPSLIIVLQGDNVTVDLEGTTFISKAGITSSTFKTIPDVPFSLADVVLPEGPYSALAANGNLCKSKLKLPTELVAQNGATIHESTPIGVAGCPKAKKAVKRKKHKKKAHKASRARKSSYGRGVKS
jgi:hypothetical protein